MTDYATVSSLKTYLRISSSTDDTLLGDLITRASRLIDDACGRWFYTVAETRQYDALGSHRTGRLLLLDADLLSVSSITNGDGTNISTDDVILRPINWPPYYGISLKQSSGVRWTYVDEPAGAISVTGTWGYAMSVPEPIVHATVRLAAWLYRQRDAGAAAGAPAHLPEDVMQMLNPYIRLRIKVVRGPLD